jgi:hypothetical protein
MNTKPLSIPAFARQRYLVTAESIELGGLLALITFYAVGDFFFEKSYDVINLVGPVALSAILAFGIWHLLRTDPKNIWTALFTFRVSTLIYFGLGSLVHMFMTPEARAYIEAFYAFSDSDNVRLNLISACCVFIVLLSSRLVQLLLAGQNSRAPARRNDEMRAARIKNYGIAFFIIGASIKYLWVFPFNIGWVTSAVPGAIVSLSATSLCGIYLLTIWSLSTRRAMFPFVCFIVTIEILMGLVLFSKTEALLPLLVFLMALVIQNPTYRRMLFAVCMVGVFMNIMQPLIAYSRDQFWLRSSGSGQMDVLDRLEILGSYFDMSLATADESAGLTSPLMRMSYVNSATFAVAMYDRGFPGNSFQNMLSALVPRLLWADKPVFNQGQEFAVLATGYEANNSVSPGLFAEAYWNFGWLGIPYVMIPLGVILALLSNYNLVMLRRDEWLFLPILFINMRLGLSVDGQFTTAVFGTCVLVVVLHYCTRIVLASMRRLGLEQHRLSERSVIRP